MLLPAFSSNAHAVSLGAIVNDDRASVPRGGAAEFKMLLYNSGNDSVDFALSGSSQTQDVVLEYPKVIDPNSHSDYEYVLISGIYVKAMVARVRVLVSNDATLGVHDISMAVSTIPHGMSGTSSMSVNVEKKFRFLVDVKGAGSASTETTSSSGNVESNANVSTPEEGRTNEIGGNYDTDGLLATGLAPLVGNYSPLLAILAISLLILLYLFLRKQSTPSRDGEYVKKEDVKDCVSGDS